MIQSQIVQVKVTIGLIPGMGNALLTSVVKMILTKIIALDGVIWTILARVIPVIMLAVIPLQIVYIIILAIRQETLFIMDV